MFAPTFEKLWDVQGQFYADRPLMFASNGNVLSILDRLREEADECADAIRDCMATAGIDQCVDLLTQDVRQEVVDLMHFTIAIARIVGMDSQMLLTDSIDKFARNMGRYNAVDYQDLSVNFDDQQEKSRSDDKRRGFTKSFYDIAA